MSEEPKGIAAALMDLSFSEFVTTRLIKIIYVLGIIGAGLGGVGMIVTGFMQGFVSGLVGIVVAPIIFALAVISVRVWLELVIVVFRIAEHTGKLAGETAVKPAASAPEDNTPSADK